MRQNLFKLAYACLMTPTVAAKCALSRDIASAWQSGQLSLHDDVPAQTINAPGRPEKPELVPPRQVKQRKPSTTQGRATLLHALAHIEFNAINLAWDAVYRFRGLPAAYYSDWIQVALEEVLHFELLNKHLRSLDCSYGDYPAHNSLWEMAQETDYDVLARMALVPRFLEARGLDVTPGIKEKLVAAGDKRAGEILDIIFRDEIGHVAAGSRWFHHVCEQRGLNPLVVFEDLIQQHLRGTIKGPFHEDARRQGGFSAEEMTLLQRLSGLSF
jgi:uncharacterized ferritin-like protein (DUF455 family)